MLFHIISSYIFLLYRAQEEGDEEEDVSGDDEESDAEDTCEADDDEEEYFNKVRFVSKESFRIEKTTTNHTVFI